MATYFHGNSEMQAADGLQTLILMNPAYVGYSENNHQSQNNNYVFLNSGGGGGNSVSPAANQLPIPHTQHFVGIPLPQESQPHEVSPFHGLIPRSQYNLWTPLDPNTAARETPRAQQGLSLSLSNSQQQKQQSLVSSSQPHQTAEISPGRLSAGTPSPASGISNGVSGMQSVLLSSKYLKVAQELLDEFVHMGKNFASKSTDASKKASASPKVAGESSNGGETSGKQVAEVSAAERQEIQMKKAKLLSLLDEVEQRYRQYHHQMQIVISSFEQAAGVGSARTYTSLALKTISKQFRCLKDTILSQLKSANKSLGEDDGLKIEGSRLKFVDHQLRQQRALQQLGMIQHNAWRPQRGLPERSVSVLRAWLFEHFLHPYPKDSDKLMLAKQTGLTRSQVSNWFINARVRLWKPMVEEMYSEEMKEHEQNGSEERATKSEQNEDSKSVEKTHIDDNYQSRTFKSNQDIAANKQNASTMSTSSASPSSARGSAGIQSGFNLIGSSELEGITQSSPKKLRGDEMLHFTSSLQTMNMDMKTDDGNNGAYPMGIERQGREGYAFMGGGLTNFIGGFGSYPMPEIGRFDAEQFQPRFSGNGVSLTLGLPDGENLSLSGNHQSFLPGHNMQTNEFGALNTPTSSHSAAAYENMNIQNRKRFATQMPDFMA